MVKKNLPPKKNLKLSKFRIKEEEGGNKSAARRAVEF
jgi:hypothetical protein